MRFPSAFALGLALAALLTTGALAQAPVKQNRRYLAVHNETAEKLVVFVQYETWAAKKMDWQWFPKNYEEGEAVAYTLPPGQKLALKHEDWPLNARRVRIWARGDGGAEFNEYRDEDLWLVETQKDGERYYLAPEGETFTFTFSD